jgi:hypothetical protein
MRVRGMVRYVEIRTPATTRMLMMSSININHPR